MNIEYDTTEEEIAQEDPHFATLTVEDPKSFSRVSDFDCVEATPMQDEPFLETSESTEAVSHTEVQDKALTQKMVSMPDPISEVEQDSIDAELPQEVLPLPEVRSIPNASPWAGVSREMLPEIVTSTIGAVTSTGESTERDTMQGASGSAAESKKRYDYWRQVLTGDPDTIPQQVREQAGAEEVSLSEEERHYRLYSVVNRSWMVDHRGESREAVAANWPSMRAHLAKDLGVGDDEQEIFLALSSLSADAPRRDRARHLYECAWQAGVKGETASVIDKLCHDIPPEEQPEAIAIATQGFDVGSRLRHKHIDTVHALVSGMDVFSAIEEDIFSAPRVFSALPDLARVVDRLPGLPEKERQLVMWLASQEIQSLKNSSQEIRSEGIVERMVRAIRRQSTGMGFNTLQAIGHMGIATANGLSHTFGGSFGQTMQQQSKLWDTRLQTLHELRTFVNNDIAPLLPDDASIVDKCLVSVAEGIPSAILSCCGGMGFAALTVAGTGDAVAEARSRSPETPQELQYAAGVVGGALQASVYMGLSRIGGKVLERSISDFMAARGVGLARYSLAGLRALEGMTAEGVSLLLGGKAAAAGELATQELASRLAATSSNIDWKSFGENLIDIEANMREAAALLPLLLIGSGRLALRHFRSRRAVLGEGKALLDWGISERDIYELMRINDIDKQGIKLSEMLRNSRRWSFPGFIRDAVKALNLLNVEYFAGFKDTNTVCDFLKLPGETSKITRTEPDTQNMGFHKLARMTGHGAARFKQSLRSQRAKDALRLWDEWWRESHYMAARHFDTQITQKNIHRSHLLRTEYYREMLENPYQTVPNELRPSGTYAPYAERGRLALLRDRAMDIRDLSNQLLLQFYALDAMANSEVPLEKFRTSAEETRNRVLGEVAKSVLRSVMEPIGRDRCIKGLGYYISELFLSDEYPSGIPATEQKSPIIMPQFSVMPEANDPNQDILRFRQRWAKLEPEEREAYRISVGLMSNTMTLMDLLPMMEDFQTALSRGMTPAQAYHHLLVRELQFDPDSVPGYPLDALASQKNVTPLKNRQHNFELCSLYSQLTGRQFESDQGENGRMYWRLQRPDGTYTRWHESCDQVADDIASNALLNMMAFGDGANVRWMRAGAKSTFDFTSLPLADEHTFSGYDQLCSHAMQDLSDFWYGNGSRMQPGMHFWHPQESHMKAARGEDGITPLVRERDETKQELYFDSYTVATPLALAHSRFRTWWDRLLTSQLVSAQQASDFLVSEGAISAEEQEKMLNLPLMPKRRGRPGLYLQNKKWPRDPNRIRDAVSESLARYTTLHFLSNINSLELPLSVRTWFNMAPFCPLPEPSEGRPKLPKGGVKADRTGLLRWGNRLTMQRIRDLSPKIEHYRKTHKDGKVKDSFFQQMLDFALGIDQGQNYEQGWCYHLGGTDALKFTPQSYWNLLQMPALGWQNMDATEREFIRQHLDPFCRHEPAPAAQEALAQGVEPDYVQAAIDNLDAQLKANPDLHRYSPVLDDIARLRLLELNEVMPGMQVLDKPVPTPLSFRNPERPVRDVSRVRKLDKLPESVSDNPHVAHALYFLNALRSYVVGRPHVQGNNIWWRDSLYGGLDGRHPDSLEDCQAEVPLKAVREILGQIYEMNQNSDKKVESCGNVLDGLSPDLLQVYALDQATVYRSSRNRDAIFRLMPGDPDSPYSRERAPYVTGNRHGVYLRENGFVLDPSERESTFIPLQRFTRIPWRELSVENSAASRMANIHDALDRVLSYADAGDGEIHGLIQNMPELMLRLMEDTGFSESLAGVKPKMLSNSQGWLLRLAADMINCLHFRDDAAYPESQAAYNRLLETIRAIRDSDVAVEHILIMLSDCNVPIKKNSDTHKELSNQLETQFTHMDEDPENGSLKQSDSPEQKNISQ